MLGLFTFVASWTNFFWPFIVLGPQNPTLPVAHPAAAGVVLQGHVADHGGRHLSTIPLIILFFIAGRQLVAGIMQGAVKG